MEKWNGFDIECFEFCGREAKIVFPHKGSANGKWMMKMEYFDAFPSLECELLNKGFHLAYIKNQNRWGLREDLELKDDFAGFICKKYNLEEKFVPIGMSCGGLFSIKFAALYPNRVSVMYLDAPVVNLLSCPCRLGGIKHEEMVKKSEMYEALNLDDSTVISYRDNPLDHIPSLIKNKIPFVLVYGDADKTVYFEENGKLLLDAYNNSGIDHVSFVKHGCDHHPHCLEDNTAVIDFIIKHA